MTGVAIVGGGIAGLASAALLARAGYDVTLLEQHAEFGGRAGSWHEQGFSFDTGPSWYLMPEVFDHFYRLLGTSAAEQLDLVTLDPGYRAFFEGVEGHLDVAASRAGNVALFESVEPGAGRQLERYLDSAASTYDIAMRRFLYTSFASLGPAFAADVLKRLPRLIRLLTEPLSTLIERSFEDERLRQILGYPAVFLGASPFMAPSMYHLMSHLDLADGVRYPLGGFARLIDGIAALGRQAGARLVTRATVRRVLVRDGAAEGVEYTDAAGVARTLEADVVVSTADVHHTETRLLEPPYGSPPEKHWRSHIPGPGAVLVMLGVRGELPELAHHNLFFARDWAAGFRQIFGDRKRMPDVPSLYVCKPSATDPHVAPPGHENLFLLVPVPADPELGRGGRLGEGDPAIESMADRAIEQAGAWAGAVDLSSRVVVRRTVGPGDFADRFNAWRGTALGPAHSLRQSAFFRTGNANKRVRGLFYAGASTVPGIGLPMCLISAEVLLKRLRGDTSTMPLAEPL